MKELCEKERKTIESSSRERANRRELGGLARGKLTWKYLERTRKMVKINVYTKERESIRRKGGFPALIKNFCARTLRPLYSAFARAPGPLSSARELLEN